MSPHFDGLEWRGDDSEAQELLRLRAWQPPRSGVYRLPLLQPKPIGLDEYAAIDHLCDEWDYGFDAKLGLDSRGSRE